MMARKQPDSGAARTARTASSIGLHRSGFAVISLALLVLAVLVLAPGVKTLLEQRREIDDLKAQIAYQQQRVDDLSEEKARWSDPSYVRAQVRERLYYVMPGEISYLLIDDREQPEQEDTGSTSRELQTTQMDWLGTFSQSVLIAGLSDRSYDQLEGDSGDAGAGGSSDGDSPDEASDDAVQEAE